MAFFDKLFGVHIHLKKVSHEFKAAYKEMYELASLLNEELKRLRNMHEELVELRVKSQGGKFAGYSGLTKSRIIWDKIEGKHLKEEGLVPELEKLAIEAKKRFESSEEHLGQQLAPSQVERFEIDKINSLLNQVISMLINIKRVEEEKDIDRKVELLEIDLREIAKVLEEFHKQEKYGIEKRILDDFQKIKLIDKVYNHPVAFLICPNKHPVDQKVRPKRCPVPKCGAEIQEVLEFTLTRPELKEFEQEADLLNSHNDPNNRVLWRHAWREEQVPEVDTGTGYAKEHINVEIRLRHGDKKPIHLLVA